MTNCTIFNADVLDWAATYDGEPFMAILCDPPYDYSFMGKDWDDAVAMKPETWAALAAHLHPGGFVMAFGGARTYHRLACAMEDAGLIVHPAIGWLNGQGFPKAARIDTQIDKAAGAERDVVGKKYEGLGCKRHGSEVYGKYDGPDALQGLDITAPATPLAAAWQGHRYGLQAMKPALEFIAISQKPYAGKPVDSITATGAGALNIEQSRIRPNPCTLDGDARAGRWPANFALVHTAGCVRVGERRVRGQAPRKTQRDNGVLKFGGENTRPHHNTFKRETTEGYADADGFETVAAWECTPECPVRKLGEQSGERPSGGSAIVNSRSDTIYKDGLKERRIVPRTDEGTAARFFYQADWRHEIAEQIENAEPVKYQAKAGRRERDAGLEEFGLRYRGTMGKFKHNPGRKVQKGGGEPMRNPHPTVKSISLTQYLATLLLPPAEYAPRRILVPFAGVMSEAIGAALAGWEDIVAVELETEYCQIGEARLAWWTEQAAGMMFPDVKQILKGRA